MTDWTPLIKQATGIDDSAARLAAAQLVQAGVSALPAVLVALAADGPHGSLAEVVCRIRTPDAIPLLLEGLTSPYFDVLVATARALGRSGAPEALAPLLALLGDERQVKTARAVAAEALGDLGFAAAVEALRVAIDQTRKELATSDWPSLLIESAVAMAKLGDHSAVDAVVEGLSAPSETARSLSADALRIVTGPNVLPALIAALHDTSIEVQLAAVDPVFLLGTYEAIEALIPLCEGEDESDDVAMRVLARLSDLLGETYQVGEESASEAWERHRAAMLPGVCYRNGRPISIPDLVRRLAELKPGSNQSGWLAAELTVITGVQVAELLETSGVDGLDSVRARVASYATGSLYKWGREQWTARK